LKEEIECVNPVNIRSLRRLLKKMSINFSTQLNYNSTQLDIQ